jgi:hypothetical protein
VLQQNGGGVLEVEKGVSSGFTVEGCPREGGWKGRRGCLAGSRWKAARQWQRRQLDAGMGRGDRRGAALSDSRSHSLESARPIWSLTISTLIECIDCLSWL